MSIDHRTLMQYFDGELGEEQAAEVEARLENDPEARRVLEGIEQVGDVVRGVMFEQAPAPDDLTDSVMARISAEPTAERRAVASDPSAQEAANDQRGPSLRKRPQFQRAVPLALGALAVAAAIALVFERKNPPLPRASTPPQPPSAVDIRPAPSPSPSERPQLELASAESVPAIAIETVDFGSREGTIFMLADGEIATPVVWLMDEPGAERDTMEPL